MRRVPFPLSLTRNRLVTQLWRNAMPFSLSSSLYNSISYICCVAQRSPEVSRVRLQAKWAAHPAASADTPIRRIAESTTFAWRASPGNTAARSAPSSRSATPTVAVLVKIPRMFPDGEQFFPILLRKNRISCAGRDKFQACLKMKTFRRNRKDIYLLRNCTRMYTRTQSIRQVIFFPKFFIKFREGHSKKLK